MINRLKEVASFVRNNIDRIIGAVSTVIAAISTVIAAISAYYSGQAAIEARHTTSINLKQLKYQFQERFQQNIAKLRRLQSDVQRNEVTLTECRENLQKVPNPTCADEKKTIREARHDFADAIRILASTCQNLQFLAQPASRLAPELAAIRLDVDVLSYESLDSYLDSAGQLPLSQFTPQMQDTARKSEIIKFVEIRKEIIDAVHSLGCD